MAVQIPLSEAAQQEAKKLLLSTQNLRHPASGEPSITPSQEMVLGCFYLTEERPSPTEKIPILTDADEARLAYDMRHLHLHTPILVRCTDPFVYDAPPPAAPHPPVRKQVQTTIGRLIFNEILPTELRYRDYPMTKDHLKALIAESLSICGNKATVQLLDQIKTLGYHYATKSGISFAMSDITMPPEREELIAQGKQKVRDVEEIYRNGEMTADEWYRQMIEIWTEITEEISSKLKDALDPFGTIMTIVKSGATKAKFQQIRQLSGIRGLMANPSGKIIPFPVLSNYLLGLLVWEIFIAASGARKGFMDRSLNTATSGYLTRRLVEAGMEVWITMKDCGTTEGIWINLEKDLTDPLIRKGLVGRVLAESSNGLTVGTLLSDQMAERLQERGKLQIRVRSPLSCQAPYGICQCCYGADLATGKLIQLGTAAGVIAGQSIGEPGTQLTMRTFHSGGIANNAADITLGLPRVEELFEARGPKHPAILSDRDGQIMSVEKEKQTSQQIINIMSNNQEEHIYLVPAHYKLLVTKGQMVQMGMPLTEGPIHPQQLLQLLGEDALQHYLINEIQHVYRGTGAFIHDKHLEVIIRQMLRYVIALDSGDTSLLPGSLVDRFRYAQQATTILAQGGEPTSVSPVLLGLTNTVLQTRSWIAAASFQDTSRMIARAAIEGQNDPLIGLKERLIIGKKLPLIQ